MILLPVRAGESVLDPERVSRWFEEKDPAPPLWVPQSSWARPPAAAVGRDGLVGCVTCGTRLAIPDADVVGEGYRCVPCSRAAEVSHHEGRGDAAAHLTRGERGWLRRTGQREIWLGIALGVAGIGLLGFKVAIGAYTPGRLWWLLLLGAIFSISIGVTRRRAAD